MELRRMIAIAAVLASLVCLCACGTGSADQAPHGNEGKNTSGREETSGEGGDNENASADATNAALSLGGGTLKYYNGFTWAL